MVEEEALCLGPRRKHGQGGRSWEGEPHRQGSRAALFWAQFQGQLQGEQAGAVRLQLAVVRRGLSLTWGVFKETPPDDHANRKNAHTRALSAWLSLQAQPPASSFTASLRQGVERSGLAPWPLPGAAGPTWGHTALAPGPFCPPTELGTSSRD